MNKLAAIQLFLRDILKQKTAWLWKNVKFIRMAYDMYPWVDLVSVTECSSAMKHVCQIS